MNEKIENLRKEINQLWKEEKWDELIPVATKLINLEKEPHDKAKAYYTLGFAYTKKGELNLALKNFDKAIELNPKHADAHFHRGLIYYRKGSDNFAIKDFNKSKDNYDLGIKNFSKTIEINSKYADAYYFLGWIYLKQEQYWPAFDNFEETIKHGSSYKLHEPVVYIVSQILVMDDLRKDQKIKAFKVYNMLWIAVGVIRYELFCEKDLEIAHYTSLHVLASLFNTEGDFRLYNTDHMNDLKEGQIFFKIIDEEYPIGKNIKECFYENKDKSYRSPAYIGSFVGIEKENKQKDKRFFWQTYGKHDAEEAAGACLIFNNKQCFSEYTQFQLGFMGEHPNVSQKKLALYKICYQGELDDKLKEKLKQLSGQLENIEKFIEYVWAERIKNALKKFVYKNKLNDDVKNQLKKENKTEDALRRLVCELLDGIRFLFKEKRYSEEKELRAIQLRYGKKNEFSVSKIKVDMDNDMSCFYIEAPENFQFNEVILGPRAERYQEWEQWLKAKAKEQDKSIDIKQSEIEYGKS